MCIKSVFENAQTIQTFLGGWGGGVNAHHMVRDTCITSMKGFNYIIRTHYIPQHSTVFFISINMPVFSGTFLSKNEVVIWR
jgi:hypothetical protein